MGVRIRLGLCLWGQRSLTTFDDPRNPDYKGFDEEKKLCDDMVGLIPMKVKKTLGEMGY